MVNVLLLLIQEGLLLVSSESLCTKYWLTTHACQGQCVVRLTDCFDMAIAVNWDVKHRTNQTNIHTFLIFSTSDFKYMYIIRLK